MSSNDATRASAQALPITPVIHYARKLAVSLRSYNKSERIAATYRATPLVTGSAGVGMSVLADDAAIHFYDEELMARSAISMNKAECLEDAVIQVAEAVIHFDMLWDHFPSEAKTFQTGQDQRAIMRLLFSVLDFLDGIAAQKMADTMGPDYVSQSMSPWEHMEEIHRQEVPE